MGRIRRLSRKKFKVNGRSVLMVTTGTITKEIQVTYNSFTRLLYVNKFPFYMPFMYRSDKGGKLYYVFPLDY